MVLVADYSDVAIANMAADILEDMPLTSLTDNTSLGRFVQREYAFLRDEMLRRYPWSFATERVVLAPETEKPAFQYEYQYKIPDQSLRVLPITCDGRENSQPVQYIKEGRKILTDFGPALYVRYIRKVTNAGLFDPLFSRALGARIAQLASMRITGKSQYYSAATNELETTLDQAFLVDSLERGEPWVQDNEAVLNVREYGHRINGGSSPWR